MKTSARIITAALVCCLGARLVSAELPTKLEKPVAPIAADPQLPRLGLIVSEDFSRSDAVANWRWGAGKWTVADGVLRGTETPERKHPAGIACQRAYHDAEIQFRFQFAGGTTAFLLLRNKFGNLCRVTISPSSLTITKDKPNIPANSAEQTVVLGKTPLTLKTGEWYSVTTLVRGEEFVASVLGHATISGRHPAIDVEKTEIEFLASGDSILFDDLRATAPLLSR